MTKCFEMTFATHSASQQCNNEVHSVAFVATRVCLLHGCQVFCSVCVSIQHVTPHDAMKKGSVSLCVRSILFLVFEHLVSQVIR